ncbi:MAG: hypothetical protein BWY86_01093 [Candidatus Aminicenantes bacterium ADurb.Bin508]|nr:MAG: hypothetical protein BWY86_01093 [Candidatus Aminicenantes bacterium ADurb.Bin508]
MVPESPEEVHVIVLLWPIFQVSPPLGEVSWRAAGEVTGRTPSFSWPVLPLQRM